jgi:hypothetical protein
MQVGTPPYRPRRRPWDARSLLQQIDASAVSLEPTQREHLKEFLWYDLCAEADAENLYRVIGERRPSYSQPFLTFLATWYEDEKNHAAGFSYLNSLLFGLDESELMKRVRDRRSDFSGLGEFLADEFKLCVLFAYDEFASVMTYQKDIFYKELGSPLFVEWITRVRSDEALHFGNVVTLLQGFHAERFHELRPTLQRILAIENEHRQYAATFLLDHECPHFLVSNDELNDTCANSVLQKISRDPSARLDAPARRMSKEDACTS